MANSTKYSTRYYQLTENILLEYVYVEPSGGMEGDVQDLVVDLVNKNKLYKIDNGYDGKRYLYCRDGENDNITGNNINNLVISLNKNDSKFIKVKNSTDGLAPYYDLHGDMLEKDEIELEGNEIELEGQDIGDVYFDKCILHFTGSNYFGDYDSLIFQVLVQNVDNSKISLATIHFTRTDDVELNSRPLLINQRLYTTHVSFRVPSTNYMMTNTPFGKAFMSIISPSNKLKKGTSIEFNVLGVKSSYYTGGFLFMNTIQLNSIQIPYFDSYKKVNIIIEEAKDGDYFKIYTQVNSGGVNSMSFSDYMYTMDATPSEYIIMHEITLYEDLPEKSIKTHSEYYLVNMSIHEDDNEIDDIISYRPVCIYANTAVSFTIEDTMRIINTKDNTTIVKKSSATFNDPSKYGKKLTRAFTDTPPRQVNIYNKRTDEDLDYVKISKSGGSGNPTVENHQYHISSLVECTNIGVSIQQMSSLDVG